MCKNRGKEGKKYFRLKKKNHAHQDLLFMCVQNYLISAAPISAFYPTPRTPSSLAWDKLWDHSAPPLF